jgi:F-type H+-transporting ATPase subunit delta
MNFARVDLAALIGEKTLHVSDTSRLALEVAAYLLEENRSSELESLMRDVLAYREAHGVVEAEAASAHELSEDVLREVKSIIKEHYPAAKKVLVHTHEDPDIVGGLKITLANDQLDMSVRRQLDTFKRLTEGIN